MKLLLRLLLNAVAIVVLSKIMGGVNVNSYFSAIGVAAVIALLNILIRPLLIILTLPITVFTFGLFLLVVNACIILLADKLLSGFSVDGFLSALIFSVLLTILQSILHSLLTTDSKTYSE